MDALRAGVIDNTLKCNNLTKSLYQGIYPSDKLNSHICKKVPCAIVVNFDKHHEPGSHWIGIFVDRDRNVEYFDSYSRPVDANKHIFKYLMSVIGNENYIKRLSGSSIQHNKTSVCGHYTILFLLCRAKNIPFDVFSNTFEDQIYSGEYDSIVRDIVNQVIKKSTSNKSNTCVCNPNQVCKRKNECVLKRKYH